MTKVTIYVDDEVWEQFKAQVFHTHANLRKLSSEVESLLRDTIVEKQAISAFEKLGITAKGTLSSQEIKNLRPKLRGPPSQEIVREMRDKRVAQILP